MELTSGKPATILIVDDEISDLEFMSFALANDGHNVLTAGSAEEALRVAGESAGIDLLITDIAMPGTSGTELAKSLLEERPRLKVLFVSGYPGIEALRYQWMQESAAQFLRKPFTPGVLVGTVRRVLAAPTEHSSGAGAEA